MAIASERLFDLNIEEVLENWEVHHALREVISNALDEQALTGTPEIEIEKDAAGRWVVRDFGRGLRIEHFTLNESHEKLAATGVIGKFGVGLKDALATFHRRGIGVEIHSRHGRFRLSQSAKHGFEDIRTLHVVFDPADSASADGDAGTEFVLTGVTDEQMSEAKALFLRFNDEEVLEETKYGDILAREGAVGRVYISGVFAAEEPNFLFSYNITHLTEGMRKRLNRERLNVGRTTYAERVKQTLRNASSERVIRTIVDAIKERSPSSTPDELGWIEVVEMALTRLAELEEVLFVTEKELHAHPDIIDHAKSDGLDIILVSPQEKQRLVQQAEAGGPVTRVLDRYIVEFNDSFVYTFVEPEALSEEERKIFERTPEILELVGTKPARRPDVLVSETMRMTNDGTHGVWDSQLRAIVVKRSELRSLRSYAATLLHEIAHALTGTVDATREFEGVLTDYLGRTSQAALHRRAKG